VIKHSPYKTTTKRGRQGRNGISTVTRQSTKIRRLPAGGRLPAAGRRHFRQTLWLPALLIALLATACAPALFDPPRRATQVALQAAAATAVAEPFLSQAPTVTPQTIESASMVATEVPANPSIAIWVHGSSPDQAQALAQIAAAFNQEHNIHVEVLSVAPKLLPQLVRTAAISETLPDLILHPVEYTWGWHERGILDAGAASAIVTGLGRNTFDPAALELVSLTDSSTGTAPMLAAVPLDGWKQLLIYRADWFDERGLAVPTTYEAMLTAAATFYQPDLLQSGLVIPTESTLVSTQQFFEQLALANGCNLTDAKGEVMFLEPACQEALDFYRQIINQYSPSDVQTDASALNAYLAGRTAMIMASPRVLPYLAALDNANLPTCSECAASATYLAQNSAFVTELRGQGDFAQAVQFSHINYIGVTRSANQEAAAAFVTYWLEEGYLDWLAMTPAVKTPMRWGTINEPDRFRQRWGDLPLTANGPSLRALYGSDLVELLGTGVGDSHRWGFGEGQGPLVTRIYEDLTMSVLLQELLSGYFSSSQAAVEAYKRLVAFIPDYAYPVELETEE
jgi:multiple sugar transport system substrate-binding protein